MFTFPIRFDSIFRKLYFGSRADHFFAALIFIRLILFLFQKQMQNWFDCQIVVGSMKNWKIRVFCFVLTWFSFSAIHTAIAAFRNT